VPSEPLEGAIVPPKSFWYLLGFLWFEGCWRYKDEIEAPAILSVKDCDGTVVELERLSPNVARRTLGVRLAPDGNNEDEVKHLRGVAEKWKDSIRTGHLQRQGAWYALTVTVMKMIEYPLLALTLTKEEQCTHIMAPILMSGLPACGSICRYFPRDVLYAPIKFQGMGLKNIYITMGLLRVDLIASKGKANSITGSLVRTSIEATKLELGIPSSLFESLISKKLVNSQQSAGLRTLGNSWQNSISPWLRTLPH
jgi:hypothetical protein